VSFGPTYAPPPPQALTLPPDPSTDTAAGMQTAAQQAADAARAKAQAQNGRQSTILTGPARTPFGTTNPLPSPTPLAAPKLPSLLLGR
jgi:hypothetical protein